MAVCTVGFAYAIAVQVVHGFRQRVASVTYQTGIITWLGLWVVAGCMYSIGLWYVPMASVLTGGLWLCLVVQRYVYGGVI